MKRYLKKMDRMIETAKEKEIIERALRQDKTISLTGEIIQEDTGSFDSITMIDLNNRDIKGEPTVKVLANNRHRTTTRRTGSKRTEKVRTCIMVIEGDKQYVMSMDTIATYTTR